MKNTLLLFCSLIFWISYAQENHEIKIEQKEKEIFREGNDHYNENAFDKAEKQYKDALQNNPNYEKANYNLGSALYQQKKYNDAIPMYESVSKTTKDKFTKAESYHNIGNALMKQKQYEKAVEAFKNSLRNNPNDNETRYNLALAQKMIKKKDADNKGDKKKENKKKNDKNNNDDKKENKKNNNDKNNKNKNNKGDKDKDKKGDNGKNKNNNKPNNNKDKQQQDKKPKGQLSKQQIKNLLEAMNKEENKTQKKINARKARGTKIKQEKDW